MNLCKYTTKQLIPKRFPQLRCVKSASKQARSASKHAFIFQRGKKQKKKQRKSGKNPIQDSTV